MDLDIITNILRSVQHRAAPFCTTVDEFDFVQQRVKYMHIPKFLPDKALTHNKGWAFLKLVSLSFSSRFLKIYIKFFYPATSHSS